MNPPQTRFYRGIPMPPRDLPRLPTPGPAASPAGPTFTLAPGQTTAQLAVAVAPMARKAVKGVLGGLLMAFLAKAFPLVLEAIIQCLLAYFQGKGANHPGDPMMGRYSAEVLAAIESTDKED